MADEMTNKELGSTEPNNQNEIDETENRGDAARFDRTKHPNFNIRESEEDEDEPSEGLKPHKKVMAPFQRDTFPCLVCKVQKDTKTQGKLTTSQNGLCQSCFDAGMRLTMQIVKEKAKTPQTFVVDLNDEDAWKLVPNPDQPKGAVIIDLETGEQIWPVGKHVDDLQQVMPFDSITTDSASGEEPEMNAQEDEHETNEEPKADSYKYSDYPGQTHYHIWLPKDLENLRADQKFVQAGESRQVPEIYRDRNDAQRRQNQLCKELGIRMEQATTRVCRCERTYWPEQPAELPSNIRTNKFDKETPNKADVNSADSHESNGTHESNGSRPQDFDQEQPAAGQTPVEQQNIEQQTPVEQQNIEQQNIEQPAVEQKAVQEHQSNGRDTAPQTEKHSDERSNRDDRIPRDFVIPKAVDWTDPKSREAFEKLSNSKTWSKGKESNSIMHQVYMHEIDDQADFLRKAVAQDNIELIKKRLVQIIHLVNSWSAT